MIFLDHNSTTPPDEEALAYAFEKVKANFFNPSAPYATNSRDLIEQARASFAQSVGVSPESLIFTSGGTEANNLAMNSVMEVGELAICSEVEHASVFNCCSEKVGVEATGTLNLTLLEDVLKKWSKWKTRKTLAVMFANNETGVITDPKNEVPALCEKYGAFLHVDAVQALGKDETFSIERTQAHTVSFSGHKIGALKGVGVLYKKKDHRLNSLQKGGSQEQAIRPGTENQIGILSIGKAVQKLKATTQLKTNRDYLEFLLQDFAQINGDSQTRISNTSSLYFEQIPDAELLADALYEKGVIVSTRSACSSGMPAPSKVLTAMFGEGSPRATKSIRLSISHETTKTQIETAAHIIEETLTELKGI